MACVVDRRERAQVGSVHGVACVRGMCACVCACVECVLLAVSELGGGW